MRCQMMKGDEVPPIPMNLETLLMEEHVDAIPWIPMDLLGNLVDAL